MIETYTYIIIIFIPIVTSFIMHNNDNFVGDNTNGIIMIKIADLLQIIMQSMVKNYQD